MSREKLKEILKILFKVAVTTVALYIVLSKVNVQELWSELRQANPWYLMLAFLVFASSKVLESLRINLFYRAKQISLTELENLKLYFLGLFYNLFLPGGIGGDGYKVYWLRKNQQAGIKPLISITILNRANGMFGMLVLLAIASLMVSFELGYFAMLPLAIPLLYIIYHFLLKWLFRDYVKTLPLATLYSMGNQFMQVLAAHLVLVAMGVQDHFADYWFIFLASGFFFAIPVTLGGLGSRELVFFYASRFLEINVSVAIAMSLLIFIIRSLTCFAGVYFVIYPDKIRNKPPEGSDMAS